MKKAILSVALVTLFFMSSCQKESAQEESKVVTTEQKENWLTATLDSKFASSQKQVTAYLFPADKMEALVKTPNVTTVRFVLGYADHTIQISVTGVDKSGKKLGTVSATVLKESNYDGKLSKLNQLTVSKTNKRTALLNAHSLLPKDAFAGIEAWQQKLSAVADLEEVTSYEGVRFRYFSLESEVILAMVDSGNAANIGLFLGLNTKGKVTTVLIGLDKNNEIKKTTPTSKEAAAVYDFSLPCPPTGDPADFEGL